MSNVRRVYVEKKPDFAVKAKELKHEVKHYLGIAADQGRVLIRQDVENVSDATYQKALQTVFSEPPVDDIYEEALTSIGNGDEAVFRYVQNEKDWTKAEITASGEGTVEVWLDGQKAGIVTICSENSDGSEEYHTCSAPIKMAAGVRELKLIFTEATELKMAEIVLK